MIRVGAIAASAHARKHDADKTTPLQSACSSGVKTDAAHTTLSIVVNRPSTSNLPGLVCVLVWHDRHGHDAPTDCAFVKAMLLCDGIGCVVVALARTDGRSE